MKLKSLFFRLVRDLGTVVFLTGLFLKLAGLMVLGFLIWGNHQLDISLAPLFSLPIQLKYSGYLNLQERVYYIRQIRLSSEGDELFEALDCKLIYSSDTCEIEIGKLTGDWANAIAWIKKNQGKKPDSSLVLQPFSLSRLICSRIRLKQIELKGLTTNPLKLSADISIDYQEKRAVFGISLVDPPWLSDLKGVWLIAGHFQEMDSKVWSYHFEGADRAHTLKVSGSGKIDGVNQMTTLLAELISDSLAWWKSQLIKGNCPIWFNPQRIRLTVDGYFESKKIVVHHLEGVFSRILNSELGFTLNGVVYDFQCQNLSWESLVLEHHLAVLNGVGRINLINWEADGHCQIDWKKLPIEVPGLDMAGHSQIDFTRLDLVEKKAVTIKVAVKAEGEYVGYPLKLDFSGQVNFQYPFLSIVWMEGRTNSLQWKAQAFFHLNNPYYTTQVEILGCPLEERFKGIVVQSDSLVGRIRINKEASGPPIAEAELSSPRVNIDELQFNQLSVSSRNWDISDLKSGEFDLAFGEMMQKEEAILSSLSMHLSLIGSRILYLNPLSIHLPGQNMVYLNGNLDLNCWPYTLDLENSYLELNQRSYLLNSRLPIVLDSIYTLRADDISVMIRDNLLRFSGYYNLKQQHGSLSLGSSRFELTDLNSLIPVLEKTPIKKGQLNFSATMEIDSGRIEEGGIEATINSIQWDEVMFSEIKLEAGWESGRIVLKSLLASNYDHFLQFSGTINPLVSPWSLDGMLGGEGEIPFYISRYLEDVYLLTGKYRIEGRWYGTINDPCWKGRLSIDSGEIFLNFLETPIRTIKITSYFDQDTLWADSVSAWTVSDISNKKSFWSLFSRPKTRSLPNIIGRGWWAYRDLSYHFNFVGDEAVIDYLPIKLDLMVDCQLDVSNTQGKQRVQGQVQLNRFNLRDDFSHYVSNMDTAVLLYNLNITMPKNIWIKNKYVNMETGGSLQLSLERNMDLPEIYGDLNVIRGVVFFYGYTFKIESGKLNFKSAAELNPEFDIQASTRIQDLTILLNVTGTLKKPEFSLSSSPVALSQEELMMIFFSSQSQGAAQSGIESGTERVLTGLISQRISQSGIRYLGVDHFSLDPTNQDTQYSGFNSMLDRLRFSNLTIGKYLTPQVFLTYSGQLTLSGDKSILVEYLINDNFSVVGEKKTDGRYRMGIRMKYSY